MGYNVIHMVEAADRLDEVEYFRLVEQCRQTYHYLAGNDKCNEQVCMMVSDKVKEVQTEHGSWPGETAFRRPRRRKTAEKNEQKVCLEDALEAAGKHIRYGSDWIVILYTAGAIRRSKRTILGKWKRALPQLPILLAIKTEQADRTFLESYTEADHIFSIEMQDEVIRWLDEYGGNAVEFEDTMHKTERRPEKTEELWKIIRDCFV